jgi:hypothetical protein
MALFEPGRQKSGGRRAGVRNKISTALMEDFLEDYAKYGKEAWKIVRKEHPENYLKLGLAFLPKELEITTNNITTELTDEELERLIEHAREQQRAMATSRADCASGTKPQTH